MNKHTPGPWHVVANLVQGKRKPNGDSRTVAMVGSSSEDDANARLIAAAPDLLAALEGLAEIVNEETTRFPANRVVPAGVAYAAAVNAIAKARGEK